MQLPKIASSISYVTSTGTSECRSPLQIGYDRQTFIINFSFNLKRVSERVENNNNGKRLPLSETDKVFKRSGIFSLQTWVLLKISAERAPTNMLPACNYYQFINWILLGWKLKK
ncbi:hypothetical protein AVEN_203650-1 [Araneus ventricosus]|uniref:Uncharacterized protein n=1 Tax=Araneus ventricosus TaxID=182803 RepID=A0A4Y2JBJ6_ARAVE|nr:hypothetical protein AVEN_203650-1 [Araneus ventricosus]